MVEKKQRTRSLEERTLSSQKVNILDESPCCHLNLQKIVITKKWCLDRMTMSQRFQFSRNEKKINHILSIKELSKLVRQNIKM